MRPSKRSISLAWQTGLIGLSLLVSSIAPTPVQGKSPQAVFAPLPKPDNMACQGWERDTVLVGFKDTATDETNYRVERSVAGAAFSEVATLTPNGSGNYDNYRDTGIPSPGTVNRRYRVRSFRTGDGAFSPYSEICSNRRFFEPAGSNFRIFFGLRDSTDDCPLIDGNNVCLENVNVAGINKHVQLQNTALAGSISAFPRFGFTRPAGTPNGGLDRIPINIVWCDGGGCAGGSSLGISPFLAETAFDLTTRVGDPVAWMVAVHELFHFQQFKYGGLNDPVSQWVIEGQARSIQDKVCIGPARNNCQAFDDVDTGYAGYVPQVKAYLGNTNRPINEAEYSAALFWTYLTEKYGTSAPGDTVEAGMNLLARFWELAESHPGDGITVLNAALTDLGHTQRFRDIWKDFAVANYAKDITGSGVQAKYRYADVAQPGGNYGPPMVTLNAAVALNAQIVRPEEFVRQWGSNYYEFAPAANVPVLNLKSRQDSNHHLYYTVLAIKNNNVMSEYNVEARDLDYTLINNAYDKVVVIVAGLESFANYRLSVNGTQPQLRIAKPTTANKVRVGSPSVPEKFLAAVEVLAGDGTPLSGVDLNSFSFKVGTQAVPVSSILLSSTVQGQQWFVMRAPTQTVTGDYNLTASYANTLSATQAAAVRYQPRTDADNVLIIDKSGSMLANNKLVSAKNAARLFVDSWRTGDQIAVESFNQAPTLDLSLRAWTDTPSGGSRQQALNAINGLAGGGATAIGDALRRGWNELKTNGGNVSHDWALVLLSDGKEEGTVTEKFDAVVNALVADTNKKPVIHTVALGPDADAPRMQAAATRTGGTYQYVSLVAPALANTSAPNAPASVDVPEGPAMIQAATVQLALDSKYRTIATEILGRQQTFSVFGPTGDPQAFSEQITVPVESGAGELVLSASWDGFMYQASLLDPSDTFVAPFQVDGQHVVWRVANPTAGNWHVAFVQQAPPGLNSVNQPQAPLITTPYFVQAAVKSDVTMEVLLPTPVEDRIAGAPMPILASLTDNTGVTGADVFAYITTPNDVEYVRRMYDDGAHGDGAANDGIYGRTFYQTGEVGSYNVTVKASGISAVAGAFNREKASSFAMAGLKDGNGDPAVNQDTDGDGLPDVWETSHGTDPNVLDATADPDNDGSNNTQEWQRGTDPLNPDTDGGGERDGSDTDPTDPGDDRIKPPALKAYPGDSAVYLRYAPTATLGIQFYRSIGPTGTYTSLDSTILPMGLYTDTTVTNGTQYCYRAMSFNLFVASGWLNPSCATPNTDPAAPHGGLLINNGAYSTTVRNVVLQLPASDTVDPESDAPNEMLPKPAADSATGVKEMLVSNRADFAGAVWETYSPTKTWTLSDTVSVTNPDVLSAVFSKYRDGVKNESVSYAATIHLINGPAPLDKILYLPVVMK